MTVRTTSHDDRGTYARESNPRWLRGERGTPVLHPPEGVDLTLLSFARTTSTRSSPVHFVIQVKTTAVHPTLESGTTAYSYRLIGDAWNQLLAPESSRHGNLTARPARTGSRTLLALSAVLDLTHWLRLSEKEVAKVAKFARRNIANWRSGGNPQPSTVRELFEVHGLVSAAVGEMGVSKVRSWLADKETSGKRRDALLQSTAGRQRLLSEIHGVLFERVVRGPVLSEVEYNELDAAMPSVSNVDLFNDPRPPRRRKPR